MSFKIGIVSLGCAKNLTDSETMLGLLGTQGYEIVSDPAQADVIIVNTCGFIESAKQESIDTILEMAEYKNSANCKYLIVTGCLAERYNDEIIEQLPEVDALAGTGDYHKICEIIKDLKNGQTPVLYGHMNEDIPDNLPRITTTGDKTVYVKIAEGCDNHCTYCIIPKLRGKYRSRAMENIVDEVKNLAEEGFEEIILIAQDTSRYGEDLYGRKCLDELIRKVSKVKGVRWVRVHYCYPEAITEELVNEFKSNEKLCKYIDMPIQHINDNVLKRMGRQSNGESIRNIISKLRKEVPGIVIRTSLIVGFPGETEEEFEELRNFVKWAQFDRLGVFKFSCEEDTPAEKLPCQIDEDVKEERYEKIMSLQSEIAAQIAEEQIGKTLEVLTEGYDFDRFMYYGRSYMDSQDIDPVVYFACENEVKIGDFCRVKILDSDNYDLIGVVE